MVSLLNSNKWRQLIPLFIGLLMGLCHWLGYPPFELPIFSILAALLGFYLFAGQFALGAKVAGLALFVATFFHLLHTRNEWYVTIASGGSTWNFFKFKWFAIIQYGLGTFVFLTVSLLLWHALRRFAWVKLPCFLAVIFTAQFFVTTSNHNDAFLIPLIASNWIKNLPLPFWIWGALFFSLLFFAFERFWQKNFKHGALFTLGAVIVILTTHLPRTVASIPEVIIHPAESFHLDHKTREQISEHFKRFYPSDKVAERIVLWPEALITFNRVFLGQQLLFEELLKEHYPGIHYFGAYTIKSSEAGHSANQYVMLATEQNLKFTMDKAYPVPFQESSDYFWLIGPDEMKLSFNTPMQPTFAQLRLAQQPVAIYLCNEIFDTLATWRSTPQDAALILVPSNPPVQNLVYYEQLIDFYSRVLARITGLTAIKYTSQGKVTIHRAGISSEIQVGPATRVHIGTDGQVVPQN